MTGILQSRCQFRNIVWFVRDLYLMCLLLRGGGGSICTFLSIYPSFFCQFCPKKGLKRIIYRQVSVQI